MEELTICIRGEYYNINEKGEIYGGPNNIKTPSGDWLFLGVSTHHLQNRIIHTFPEIWKTPSLALNGYLWDRDHGTVRTWGGQYNGKIPRITHSCKWKHYRRSRKAK